MREIAHIRATMLGRFALQQTGMKEPRMVSLAGRSGRLLAEIDTPEDLAAVRKYLNNNPQF